MSDIVAALGAPSPIKIGGKEYLCAPPTLRGWADIHARLKAQHRSALARAAESLNSFPKDVQGQVIREAMNAKQAITPDDVANYLQTPEGVACFFWVMARKHQPEVSTFDDAWAIVGDEDMVRLSQALLEASGFEEAKNYSGGRQKEQTTDSALAS